MRTKALLLPLLLAGCLGGGPSGPLRWVQGEALKDPGAAYRKYMQALSLEQKGRGAEAEALALELIGAEPLFVPAWRLHQNHLLAQGRKGLCWREVEDLRARFPDRPEPLYLEARLIPDFEEKRAAFTKARRRFPGSYWLAYGLAWCETFAKSQARRRWAEQTLFRLIETGRPVSEVWVLYMRTLRRGRDPSPHLARLRSWEAEHPEDGRLPLLLYRHGSKRFGDLLKALSRGPALSELGGFLLTSPSPEHRRFLVQRLAVDRELREGLLRNGKSYPLARLALSEGEVELAEAWLANALGGGGRNPGHTRGGRLRTALEDRIRIFFRRGDLEGALAFWESRLPPGILDREGNLCSDRILPLLEGPLRGRRGLPETPAQGAAELRILLRAGWVAEAETLGRFFLRGFPGAAGISGLVREAQDFRRFEMEIQDWARREAAKSDLRACLRALRELSLEVYGEDRVGAPRILDFPLLGMGLVDPFGNGLPRFFDRYNRHLLIGRGLGPGVQVLMGRKLHTRELTAVPGLPLRGRCYEVLLETKQFSNLEKVRLVDPAGLALWNHYILDLGALRNWVCDLLENREGLRAQGLSEVLEDPFPGVPPLDASRHCQIQRKVNARAVEGRSPAWIWKGVYELLRLHERAHLVEAHKYLPVLEHLTLALGRALSAGFSPRRILALAEGRAECAAMVHGADPLLGLAHLAGFLPDNTGPLEGAHARGFQRILRKIVERWEGEGAPGALDPGRNLYAQLHRMSGELVLRYAKEVLESEGF